MWLIWACAPGVVAAQPAAERYAGDLQSSDAAVRAHAARSLGRLGDPSAVPTLIAALNDPQKDVRREAAKALGSLRDARAVAPLGAALGDGEMNVRLYAAYALGEIKDAKAAGPLLDALGDPQWCVRDQAAWALREIGDPRIAGPLAAALKEQTADVAHIIWLLRHLGSAQTVEHLAALLEDADAGARMRAAAALGELHDAAAVDPLVAALKDSDPGVRRTAVEALEKIGDGRAENPLAELVLREQDRSVAEAAKRALVEMSCLKDLAAHWSFDDRSPSVASDVTGCGNDGQIIGCTPVEGKLGAALRFGPNRYVELGRPAGLPIAEQPLTVMAWVRSEAADGVVVARGGAFCGFSLYVMGDIAKFGIHRTEEGPASIAAGREAIGRSWVHLAGVIRSDRIELYMNGKLAATTKTKGYIPGNCGQGMEIGFDAGNSPAEITNPFEGIIDEVQVYQAALAEEDIAKQCRAKP